MTESEIVAEVTFHIPDDAELINALHAQARKLDIDNEVDPPDTYTLVQALQVVWHLDPHWLHDHFLKGWILHKAAVVGAEMRPIWENQ